MFEKNSKGVDKKEEDDFRPRNSEVSLAISKCFFLPAYFYQASNGFLYIDLSSLICVVLSQKP